MDISTNSALIQAQKALQKYWNYPDFREKQRLVIQHVLNHTNTLALLPTGGGKSICYQVPAIVSEGLTVVVSPLISLMEDQVKMLRSKGIKADYIHSGLTSGNIDRILDNTIYGDTKLLYVSPERLSHPLFLVRMNKANVSLVAIDEAHCISQWGHDFRPSYMLIKDFLEAIGKVNILAVTATATPQVVAEICDQLKIKEEYIVRDSFERNNIAIARYIIEDKMGKVVSLAQSVQGKTIIYARSRRNVEMIAKTLRNHGLKAQHYHAGLSYSLKQRRQKEFGEGKTEVMVATNAFGMGIDVSDVRHVIHYDLPPSIEEYYQEIGRAGRDGAPSFASLLVSEDNVSYAERRLKDDFQDFELLQRVYKVIHVQNNIGILEGEGQTKVLDLEHISHKSQLSQKATYSILKSWQVLGILELSQDDKDRFYVKALSNPREIRDDKQQLGKLYDVLVKIMRDYESIFDNWAELDYNKLAQELDLNHEDLLSTLRSLAAKGYIKLYESLSGQRVTFLRDRWKQSETRDFKRPYLNLIKRYTERWDSMKGLITTDECLSTYIIKYFGEIDKASCKMCSNCNDSAEKPVDYLEQQRRESERY